MPFKSKTQPLCRCCGIAIKKWSKTLTVYDKEPHTHAPEMAYGGQENRFQQVPTGRMTPVHVPDHVVGVAHNRDEAKRLTNLQVLSIRKGHNGKVHTMSVWDGETYEDEFFCTNECANGFARMVAKHPENKIQSVAYVDALHYQKTGKYRA